MFVYLLLATEIILLIVAIFLFRRIIISPSIVTISFFLVQTLCFIYNMDKWDVVFTYRAYWLFTLTFIIAIAVEYVFMRLYKKKKWKQRLPIYAQRKRLKHLYIPHHWNVAIIITLTVATLVYISRVYQVGVSLGGSGLSAIGMAKEEAEYDTIARLFYNLVRFVSYVYAMIWCNNIFANREKFKKNIGYLFVMVLFVICAFFSGQRSSVIAFFVSILVFVFVSRVDGKCIRGSINWKKIFCIGFITVLFGVTIFYLSNTIVKGRSTSLSMDYYITYYLGSPMALMGKIVENPSLCHEPFVGYFGEKTFQGLYKNLYSWGIISQAPADRLWIRLGGSVSQAGNEFTFLCGPYIDFGFVGALIFMGIFYSVFDFLLYKFIDKRPLGYKKEFILFIFSFLYIMVAMCFYQDTIRSYVRPINLFYIAFTCLFIFFFVKKRKAKYRLPICF